MKKKLNTELLDATKDLLREIDDSLEGSRQVIMQARMDSLFVGEGELLTDEEIEGLAAEGILEEGWGPCGPDCVEANGSHGYLYETLDVVYDLKLNSETETERCYHASTLHPLFMRCSRNNLDALAYQTAVHGEPVPVRENSYSSPARPVSSHLHGGWRKYFDERVAYHTQRLNNNKED